MRAAHPFLPPLPSFLLPLRSFLLRRRPLLTAVAAITAALLLCQCSERAGTPADFVFVNGAEVGSIDPAEVSSQIDGRVVNALFEGLMRYDGTGRAEPGAALEPVVSPDGLTWTFTVRDTARWSNGQPVTARDFFASYRRFLDPETNVDYASIFYSIKGAEEFKEGRLTDFDQVGIHSPDERTIAFTLTNPVPYFREVIAFMSFCPVHMPSLTTLGRDYFKPGNLIGNGPYTLAEWRLNDRIRLVRNPHYWDAANVKMEVIDVLPVDNPTTALNLFLTGEADLMMDKGLIPNTVAGQLTGKPWFHHKPFLATWFLRFNHKRPPFDNPLVRKALTMAIDRQRIVTAVTRLGEEPARTFTPPGIGSGYTAPAGLPEDIAEARRLLAEAGYPDGRGFPVLNYLYPSKYATDRGIAVELQSMWQQHLGITVNLTQQEYKVYLDSQKSTNYDVSRSSWIGDYNDPNTFLDVFLTTNGNNRTGWGSPEYDARINAAAAETDPARRNAILHDAEVQLVETECVIAPVYFYVGVQFFRPDELGGIEANLTDEHPLRCLFWKSPPTGRKH